MRPPDPKTYWYWAWHYFCVVCGIRGKNNCMHCCKILKLCLLFFKRNSQNSLLNSQYNIKWPKVNFSKLHRASNCLVQVPIRLLYTKQILQRALECRNILQWIMVSISKILDLYEYLSFYKRDFEKVLS